MVKIFIGVIVAVVAIILVFTAIDPNVSTGAGGLVGTSLIDDDNNLVVKIDGEVNKSGTYALELNSTLDSLLEVANGVTSNADELAYNTNYVLKDGDSLYIAPKFDMTDVCTNEPIAKVDINNDDSATLQEISGIGSTIAEAIVSYRQENGEFECIEEVMDVSGIGNATFAKIKNYITLRSS